MNRLAEVIPESARRLGQETGTQSPKFFPGGYSELPPWLGRGTVSAPTVTPSTLPSAPRSGRQQASVPLGLTTHKGSLLVLILVLRDTRALPLPLLLCGMEERPRSHPLRGAAE